ncbi:MAG: hypothetical protein WDN45_04260 [Caulobacteraceae bacterium]
MYILLDLAVGGPWAGPPAGEKDAFAIDYVRAYALNQPSPRR